MPDNYCSKSECRRGPDSIHSISHAGWWVGWCIKKCLLHEYASNWWICGDGFSGWSALLLFNTAVCI